MFRVNNSTWFCAFIAIAFASQMLASTVRLNGVRFAQKQDIFRVEVVLSGDVSVRDIPVKKNRYGKGKGYLYTLELPVQDSPQKSYRIPDNTIVESVQLEPSTDGMNSLLTIQLMEGSEWTGIDKGPRGIFVFFAKSSSVSVHMSSSESKIIHPIPEENPSPLKVASSDGISDLGDSETVLEKYFLNYQPGVYRIGVGDELTISVYEHPDLNKSFIVTSSGNVTFPLIGLIPVLGLTLEEVSENLKISLETDYLVDPKINVVLSRYDSQWVQITGSVVTPSKISLTGPLTLGEALATVGGIRSSRSDGVRPAYLLISRKLDNKQTVTVKIRTSKLQRTNNLETKIFLKSEDHINVMAEPDFCFVTGEVSNPGKYVVVDGTNLVSIIIQAGGFTDWSNKKMIDVVRKESDGPVKLKVNIAKIQKGILESFIIHPGDVIRVKKKIL